MNTIEAIKTRRSVRKFKQQEIPDNDLIDLIDCAHLAPSAANKQPLEYIIIKNSEIREQIFQTTKWAGYIAPKGTPVEGEKPTAFIVVLTDNDRMSQWKATRDAGAAIENILIAGQAKGIASCWIISADMEKVREILKIDAKYSVDSLIALGYPAEKSVVCEMDNEVKYWKDDKGLMHVPKRPLKDIYTII